MINLPRVALDLELCCEVSLREIHCMTRTYIDTLG